MRTPYSIRTAFKILLTFLLVHCLDSCVAAIIEAYKTNFDKKKREE